MKKTMKATMRLCTLAVMLIAVSFSMSAADALLGKWQQTVDESGVKVVTTYEFNADGTMKQVMDMTSSTAPRIKMKGEGTCKYTFQDNTLTFKFNAKDFNFPVFEVEGVDQATTDAIMQQTKESMGAMEQKVTDIKISGNKLTGTFNGESFELTRL
jgi:hypothetical protein